jgi:hypothetical protein
MDPIPAPRCWPGMMLLHKPSIIKQAVTFRPSLHKLLTTCRVTTMEPERRDTHHPAVRLLLPPSARQEANREQHKDQPNENEKKNKRVKKGVHQQRDLLPSLLVGEGGTNQKNHKNTKPRPAKPVSSSGVYARIGRRSRKVKTGKIAWINKCARSERWNQILRRFGWHGTEGKPRPVAYQIICVSRDRRSGAP